MKKRIILAASVLMFFGLLIFSTNVVKAQAIPDDDDPPLFEHVCATWPYHFCLFEGALIYGAEEHN